MSAEPVWRVRLSCTRAEAEAIPFADDAFPDLASPPTLLTDEPDPARPDDWLLDAYFTEEPGVGLIARLHSLAPSAALDSAAVERLSDNDWVTMSQAGLEPVRAGRYFVHTAAHAAERHAGDFGIRIEAGLAFGIGQHFTTHGCLAALDALSKRYDFADVLTLAPAAASSRWRPPAPGPARASSPATSIRSRSRLPRRTSGVTASVLREPQARSSWLRRAP